jgi:hypothetical protein
MAEDFYQVVARLVADLKSGRIKIPNNSGGANGAQILAKIAGLDVSGGTLSATGAAPGDQTESTVVIGQKDSSVGSTATLDIETEEDVVVVGTFTPSHKLAVWINGTEYHIQLDAV